MPPAAPDQLRRANTALVVRTLRDAGPSSRTSLARRTGLAKATVGAIVGELSERAVVVEGDASSQGRGRPSRPVELAAGSGPVECFKLCLLDGFQLCAANSTASVNFGEHLVVG